MIIRATTKEELREVLTYMCIYLGQTQVRIDLDDSTAPVTYVVPKSESGGWRFSRNRGM